MALNRSNQQKLENIILVANKTKSFDKSLTGDFNLNSKIDHEV